jgi:ubiquinone biosynthesis protein
MDEGVAADLDPEFRLIEALRPYAYRQLLAELSPPALARRVEELGVDLVDLAVDFPGQLHRLLELLTEDGLGVHLRAAELEPLVARAERLGNRIVAAVLAAAVIDGAAELAARGARPRNPRKLFGALAGLVAFGAYATGRRTRGSSRSPGIKRRAG